MIPLSNVTFIIPLCIESKDRYNNSKTVLNYLNYHFETNVIIHEISTGNSKLDFLSDLKNLKIKHILENSSDIIYHRTRQLNEMLDLVETDIVANYDVDVILPIDSYIESENLITNCGYDVVYPYGEGRYQKRIFTSFDRKLFHENFDINLLKNDSSSSDFWNAKCGHCFFIKTKVYRNCSGENEEFIAYGPEDSERYDRFQKFSYKLSRVNDLIFHFEHERTPFSDFTNKFFGKNNELYENLKKLSSNELTKYYENIEYKKKYKNFN